MREAFKILKINLNYSCYVKGIIEWVLTPLK